QGPHARRPRHHALAPGAGPPEADVPVPGPGPAADRHRRGQRLGRAAHPGLKARPRRQSRSARPASAAGLNVATVYLLRRALPVRTRPPGPYSTPDTFSTTPGGAPWTRPR